MQKNKEKQEPVLSRKQKSLYTPANSQKHTHVDDIILSFANAKTYVATQDKEFKKKLKKKGAKVLVLRKKQYVELV